MMSSRCWKFSNPEWSSLVLVLHTVLSGLGLFPIVEYPRSAVGDKWI